MSAFESRQLGEIFVYAELDGMYARIVVWQKWRKPSRGNACRRVKDGKG